MPASRWVVLAVALCASAWAGDQRGTNAVGGAPRYLRVASPDSNTVALQVAVRQFVPADRKAPVVWLVAASHVGDSNYFQRLQQRLDAQGLVLFEGVTEQPGRPAMRKPSAESDAETQLGNLQTTLAESLGLVFQMEVIDYDRRHFRHSDLSIQELQHLIEQEGRKRGAGGRETQAEFDELLRLMEGNSWLGVMLNAGIRLFGSSPKLQAMARLALIEALGRVGDDFGQMQALPEELSDVVRVLIEARNAKVLRDLTAELKRRSPPSSIAIFYGAAHMRDFERRLVEQMKYRPGEQAWLTAFSVDVKKSGLTAAEVEMIRSLVKNQLELLQKEATPAHVK